ncbi:DNA translocase FtsK [Synergistales bacterium]|nr:DNA translocase FtsK [Synergistales bacterium]
MSMFFKNKRSGKRPSGKKPVAKKAARNGGRSGKRLGCFGLIVCLFMCAVIYVIGALLGWAWTGLSGRAIGEFLRDTFGGAIVAPLLFLIYICAASLMKRHIPRPLGQVLGVIFLYLSVAFTLGLFVRAGWSLPWRFAQAGYVGVWLSRFFWVNLGLSGAVAAAFVFLSLSAVFFGFHLPLQVFTAILIKLKQVEFEHAEAERDEPIKPVNPISEERLPKTERIEHARQEEPEPVPQIEEDFTGAVFPPPLDIFGPVANDNKEDGSREIANQQAGLIVETLQNFGVKSSVAHIVIGPSVIQFQLELAPGVKVSKVSGLSSDLTMALAVNSVRVEAPVLGQRYVGIEIPNPKRKGITMRSVMESAEFAESEFILPLPMGVLVDSKHLICGLEDMPHMLVAGTTGSGKSVFTNTCILGMCSQRTPDELKLILVDPKQVEFAIYEGLPHLLSRPVSEPKKAVSALAWAVREMESRSEAFAKARVRNLASYNEKALPKHRFPHIVVVVDELADLMYTAGKEVEGLIVRLAQKARSSGIHLILATQRPSVDVITGLIKANIPARVAFAVPSQTDSRTIIDKMGAEKLLGKGDMLFYSSRYPHPMRLQASFATEEHTLDFVEYMKNAFGEPEYIEFEDMPSGAGSGGDDLSLTPSSSPKPRHARPSSPPP